jgi:hypothetical protein
MECCAALDLIFLSVTMLRNFVMFIFFVKKIDQVYKWFGWLIKTKQKINGLVDLLDSLKGKRRYDFCS